MPTYYIMEHNQDMAETVAPHMPSADAIARCAWLTDAELRVYSSEYERTGFQGGLQWYRCRTEGIEQSDLQPFSGRTIDVPSLFVAGRSDWGVYQVPGTFEAMRNRLHEHDRFPASTAPGIGCNRSGPMRWRASSGRSSPTAREPRRSGSGRGRVMNARRRHACGPIPIAGAAGPGPCCPG